MTEQEKKPRQRYPKGEGPGKGNKTNHPSRKGIKLKPEKPHKTERFPDVRLTPEELAMLNAILEYTGVTVATWLTSTIADDYRQLPNLTDDKKLASN